MQFALRSGEPPKTIGKLSFIDLAGSERGADTYDNDKQVGGRGEVWVWSAGRAEGGWLML